MKDKQLYILLISGLVGNIISYILLTRFNAKMGPIEYLESVWIIGVIVCFMLSVVGPIGALLKMSVSVFMERMKWKQ